MSRGHGKWERLILQKLEQQEAFYLTDLLLDQKEAVDLRLNQHVEAINTRTRSNLAALRRAASSLINSGKVDFWYDHKVHHRLVIARPRPLQPDHA